MLKFSENKASEDKIIYESLNLVLERVIPIPHKLYEEVLDAIHETTGGLQHVRELPQRKILESVVNVINVKNKSSLLAKDYLDRGKIKEIALTAWRTLARTILTKAVKYNVKEEFYRKKSNLQDSHAIIL